MLAATALALGACGGDEDPAPPQPGAQTSAASDAPPAGVSGKAAQSPAKLCAAQPKKKTKGTKGKSPFAQCVSAVKKAAAGDNPARACKGLSKKKTKGVRGGTPFSLCVRAARQAAAQAAADEAGDELEDDAGGTDTTDEDASPPADGGEADGHGNDDNPGRGNKADEEDEEPAAEPEPDAEDEDF